MRRPAALVALASLALAACGSPLDTPDGGPPATAADGGGVCCPLTASEGCSSIGYFGGWASSGSQCVSTSTFDGPPQRVFVDDHGCRVLRADLTAPYCGRAVDAGTDSGTDGETSDASDATDTAMSDGPND